MRTLSLAMLSFLTACSKQPGTPPEFELEVTASMRDANADRTQRQAVIKVVPPPGHSLSDSGIPGWIVQLDVPDCVTLTGKRVLRFEELRDNEFLMEPWERLSEEPELVISLRVDADAEPAATLGINVLSYIAAAPGTDDHFVRRRLELPLHANATARPGNAEDTRWGPFGAESEQPSPLAINDTMPALNLPRLGSSERWSSEGLFGTKATLLVTYRGHW